MNTNQLDFTYKDKQCSIMKHTHKGVTRFNAYVLSYKTFMKTCFEHVGTSDTQTGAFQIIKTKVGRNV